MEEHQKSHLFESALLSKLVPGVLHEANNALQIALGKVEDVQSQLPASSEYQPDLQTVQDEIQHCSVILEKIRFFKKCSREPAFHELNSTLQQILDILKYYIHKKRLEFTTKIPKDISLLEMPTNELYCILIGLFFLAVDYAKEQSEVMVEIGDAEDITIELAFRGLEKISIQNIEAEIEILKFFCQRTETAFVCKSQELNHRYILKLKKKQYG